MREPGWDGTGLLTDHYELTMLRGALHSGVAHRRSVFEVFARYLPHGRRYGVVAGIGRLLDALAEFRFGPAELDFLRSAGITDEPTLRVPGVLPVQRGHLGLRGGRLLLPRLARSWSSRARSPRR